MDRDLVGNDYFLLVAISTNGKFVSILEKTNTNFDNISRCPLKDIEFFQNIGSEIK